MVVQTAATKQITMKHFAMPRIVVLIAAVLFVSAKLYGAVPDTIHHQGRVAVNGVNYDGPGFFKFLIFTDADANHASGNEVALWKNDDGVPVNLATPVASVQVLVSKGLYALQLGANGQAALPPSIGPPAGRRVYLRIWFDNGVNGLQQLTPDQELVAVPFARHAETASSFTGNLNLGSGTFAADTVTVGAPANLVTLRTDAQGLAINGNFHVESVGLSSFLGDLEIENKLIVGTVNSSLSPHVDNTFDLGISPRRWRQLFLGPTGLSIGDSGDLVTLSFNPATDLLTISRDTLIGGRLSWGQYTQATGDHATAFGDSTLASDLAATAWGLNTVASAKAATAWGGSSEARNDYATAWGESIATGVLATAWGHRTTAPSYAETALGRFNTEYTPTSATSWAAGDRLFVIGNGTSVLNRSDALVILKNGAASFSGAVGVAGDLNVTGAVNYGSLSLPANVMLEGESLGLMNNDAGFLASPNGTVQVPEESVQTAVVSDREGLVFSGNNNNQLTSLAANGKGYVAAFANQSQEFLYLKCEPSGAATERYRIAASALVGFPAPPVNGYIPMTFDPTSNYDGFNYDHAAAYSGWISMMKVYENINGFSVGGGRVYRDDSVFPGSQFTRISDVFRLSMHGRLLAATSPSEGAVTVIDTTKSHTDPAALVAVLEPSPTLPIYNPVDVLVTSDLVIVAGKASDTVQLFGRSGGPSPTISVKGKITDGIAGFTRVADPELLAHNGGLLLAVSSTVDDAITLANVSDAGNPQPVAVIEGRAHSMVFKDANTLIVRRSGGISVLDVSNPGSVRESMKLNTVNTPSLQIGGLVDLQMAHGGILASASDDVVGFVNLNTPPATQSLHVAGWLGLGVERAYAPLHVNGSVIVEDADTIHFGGTNFTGTAERIALGTNAHVVNTGVALGGSAFTLDGGTAIGSGTRAEGRLSSAIGAAALAYGTNAIALGTGVIANSMGETALGTYNTDHPALSRTSFDPADRLLVVGNGWNTRSDALVMLKNGNTTLNGALTVNGGATVTGALNVGSIQATTFPPEVAQTGVANVFTEDVTTQKDFKYAAPKTARLRVSASAFSPGNWHTARRCDFNIGEYIYLEDVPTPADAAVFVAPVSLPAGATITKVQFHYMDNQGQGVGGTDEFDATVQLSSVNMSTGASSGVFFQSFTTSGQSATMQVTEGNVSHVVSDARSYRLRFTMTNCAGANLRFYGATIEYTTTTLQP